MANIFSATKFLDTTKKTIICLRAQFDGSGQEANAIKVDASTLAYAANANNLLMVANTHPKATYRTTIKSIDYNIGLTSGGVKLLWDGNGSFDPGIVILGAKTAGKIKYDDVVLNNPNVPTTSHPSSSNSNGDIYITTSGAAANDSYTIILELAKNPYDFLSNQNNT